LAGSFGYQRGHEELAERSLAPAVRASPNALVLADGCRSPRRRALHLAGLLDVNSLEWTERRAAVVFSPTDGG
jgi:hypothetical protein